MKDIKEILGEFAYDLSDVSPQQIKEPIKIILPYYLYRKFLDEMEKSIFTSLQNIEMSQNARIKGRFIVNNYSGAPFIVSCKEVEDEVLHKSLKNFFKDINEG